MNPALTPISEVRAMSNAQLVAYAKEHSHLTILERELLKRMEDVTRHESRREKIQSIVDWARNREMQS
jgi:hypothetical protein